MPADRPRPRKRQRATQACHRCRLKKFRCDAEGLPCGVCQSAQAECLYDDAGVVRRRGLKPGYVKILESLWGSVLQSIPGSEQVATRLLARLSNSAEPTANGNRPLPLETWRSSTLPAAIDALLNGEHLRTPEDPSHEHDGASHSPLTDVTWSLPQPIPPREETPRPTTIIELPVPPIIDPQPRQSPRPSADSSSLPDMPADWQNLVQVYLCTEQCWLPLFEKSSLYCWAYKYEELAQSNILDLDCTSRGHFATLWATFILAELHLNGAASERIDQLEQVAKTLLVTVGSVEPGFTYSAAHLVWALIYIGRQSMVHARMMLAQAIVLSDPQTIGAPTVGNMQRTLLLNGCFTLDVVTSFASGARRLLPDEPAVSFAIGDVGEWDPYVNILQQEGLNMQSAAAPPSRIGSIYVELMKLIIILRSVIQKNASYDTLARELENWKSSLPDHLAAPAVQESTRERSMVPSQSNLHVWYLVVSHMIAKLQQQTTASANAEELADNPAAQVAEAIEAAGRRHGLGALPSITSIVVQSICSRTPSMMSASQMQVLMSLGSQWGWLAYPPPIVNNSAAVANTNVSRAQRGPTRSGIALQSPLHSMDQQASHFTQRHDSTPRATPNQILRSIDRQNPANSQPTLASQVLAVDPTVTAAANESSSCNPTAMENPFSHDLLDYLTMFEGDESNESNYMEPLGFFPP
ncbi:hypothetical protein Q7P37_002259 [Cladosporium fusiforme]